MGVEQIVLVHALNTRHANMLYQQLLSLSAREMEKQKVLLEEAGFEVELEMPVGIPQYEINRVAAERNVSLIVVYSTAESLFGDIFSGAIAYEVINQAAVPVLVMKARMSEEQCEVVCPNLMARILFATDFSDTANKAFQAVEHLVRKGCTAVTLAHVQDKARIEPHLTDRLAEFNQIDSSRLQELETRLRRLGATRVDIRIPYGSPAEELLRISRENEGPHTLIVMGSRGRGFIRELFVGSVSHFMVRRAAAPVLLVPVAPPLMQKESA